MGVKILILYILRLTILLLSLCTLGCHVAQLILLNQVSGTGEWWPHFIPYILYYVGPIVSISSATILLVVGCVFSKSLWSDRITACVNILLFIAIIVYNSLKSSTIPWTGSVRNANTSSMKGYVTYCSNYSDPLMSNRCWLTNGTWLGMLVVGFLWLSLALYAFILKNSNVDPDDYDIYDFKDDVPMTMTTDSGIPEPPKHNLTMNPYMEPHRDYVDQSQRTHYNSTSQAMPVYGYNNNMPIQDPNLYKQQTPARGFERQRKLSKTYVEEEEGGALLPASTTQSADSSVQQPPHSYDT